MSRGRGRGNGRGRGRGRGRGGGRGRGRGPPGTGRGQDDEGQHRQKFDIKKVRCYNCNEYGHFQSDCKAKRKGKNEAHLVEQFEEESTLLMLETSELIHIGEEKEKELMLNEE
ncbi:U3 small nucleolar RNA-associated protein 25-like [Manihot esculenta]|uniref:U3 small nucleolar RNA-associated protein 25-like n=1 Tax=Manihot esculenta TaxID=3983 RepID=UPI000B5D4F2F|nr:U3 small nucleolar RNA-associated protein 25-like [Manihot esculenta]